MNESYEIKIYDQEKCFSVCIDINAASDLDIMSLLEQEAKRKFGHTAKLTEVESEYCSGVVTYHCTAKVLTSYTHYFSERIPE